MLQLAPRLALAHEDRDRVWQFIRHPAPGVDEHRVPLVRDEVGYNADGRRLAETKVLSGRTSTLVGGNGKANSVVNNDHFLRLRLLLPQNVAPDRVRIRDDQISEPVGNALGKQEMPTAFLVIPEAAATRYKHRASDETRHKNAEYVGQIQKAVRDGRSLAGHEPDQAN